MTRINFYIKHVVKMALASKLRFILLIMGLVIGLFGFSFGRVCLNNYYDSFLREVEAMPDNTEYVSTEGVIENVNKKMMSISQNLPVITKISHSSHQIFFKPVGNKYIEVYGLVHGVSQMSSVFTLLSTKYGIDMVNIKVVKGRALTQAEINQNEKVCLIDELTEELMFDGDAVGKEIEFNSYDGMEEIVKYEVVGVIKDSFYSQKNREYVDNELSKDDVDGVFLFTDVICPFNVFDYIKEYGEPDVTYLWHKNKISRKALLANLTALQQEYRISPLIDKDSERKAAENQLKDFRYAIKYGTFILLAVSGIFCMSIMFFAMKERATEIGIKKAYGADSMSMMGQFVLENIFIAILASGIIFGITYLAIKGSSQYIIEKLASDYIPSISGKDYLVLLGVAIAQNIIFTIIPVAIYSSKQVVKIIKMD